MQYRLIISLEEMWTASLSRLEPLTYQTLSELAVFVYNSYKFRNVIPAHQDVVPVDTLTSTSQHLLYHDPMGKQKYTCRDQILIH